MLKGRLRVAALHSSGEAVVGGFDVAIAMVNTDDVNSVFVFQVLSPFKIFAHLFDLAPVRLWIHLTPDSESDPWESHPCASAQLFREVSLSYPTVIALPVAVWQWRPTKIARMEHGHSAWPPGSGGGECIR